MTDEAEAGTRKRYVAEYLYPGFMFPEETYRSLREPTLAAALAAAPAEEEGYFKKDGWYGVRVKTVTEKRYAAADGEETWVAQGQPEEWSAIIGQAFHLDDPEIAGEEHATLRSNIRSNSKNGYGVKTRLGNWQIADDWTYVVGAP